MTSPGKPICSAYPHPLLDAAEGVAVEQVGGVHGVPGAAQFLGEGDDAGG
jgi:hypothetical protein